MFLVHLIVLPFRVGFFTGRVASRVSYRAGRLVGFRRMFLVGAGVALGLAVAPASGAKNRAWVQARIRDRRPSDDTVGERVRFELSHSSHTWHLPQPDVQVAGGVVVLTGAAPHQSGKADLERAAASVAGVERVENRIELNGSSARP
jgi:osmotically-inducible protein OsmY